MKKLSGHVFLAAFAAGLLLAPLAPAAAGADDNLASVTWLQAHLGDADLLILDASPAPVYAAQHIPGAVGAGLATYGVHELPLAELERIYQSWGVDPGLKIMLYDQGAAMNAARLFFDLYYHGFPAESLLILDGGMAKWQEAGLPVTAEATPARQGSFRIVAPREEARALLPEVLTACGDPAGNALIDALGANWHFGEVAVFDRSGHIPNSVLLPSGDFLNADKTFKSPEEIGRMLAYLGIGPERHIYTYCGGGVAACVPFFALKFMLDYPEVELYRESEMGWMQDERQLPCWTYDAPYLMREAGWLQFWGGNILRMYGGAQVSIVDLRPAEAFAEGHVPFALNVPAAAFASGLGDPARLAAALGPAGVDPAHEAVVFSGAGLTPQAALAFLALERLGQAKVSVFMGSLEAWAQAGFAVSKDPTAVGPKKAPHDLSIPAVTYPGAVRAGVLATDAATAPGSYPKVFVASGKDMPARAQDGTVVHVPYTDLLNADGTPKAAKDIWNVLAKAGVPRYAELVCFADDPGEAAANYFILRLMGWPQVKVLAM